MATIKSEEFRTLPHFAVVTRVCSVGAIPGSARQFVQILPTLQVFRAIEQDATTHLRYTRAHGQVIPFALLPGRRITETRYLHSCGRQRDDRLRIFRPRYEIGIVRPGQTL